MSMILHNLGNLFVWPSKQRFSCNGDQGSAGVLEIDGELGMLVTSQNLSSKYFGMRDWPILVLPHQIFSQDQILPLRQNHLPAETQQTRQGRS